MNKHQEKPSTYTLLYWLIQDKKIDPEDIFNFLELYWPSFIKKDECVFLKDNFSEEEYSRLIKGNDNAEYWINLCVIDEFFSEVPDTEAKSISLANMLAGIWSVKLRNDFPHMNFVVECLLNKEYGDCGLTFYQTDDISLRSGIKCREIASPNIKENKITQSLKGPRPGMPRIRKPRPEETPNSPYAQRPKNHLIKHV